MPKLFQVHGMLLEEAVLFLLRFSGYRPIDAADGSTVFKGVAGLEVAGRGERHQIDAIADFTIPQPFVNPARLLVEAKFKNGRVGIETLRNAVGVLKDVSEYWGRSNQPGMQPRFHYQYAILASSGFSQNAQRYAVAHDIYLIPFERAKFFRPVLDAIRGVEPVARCDRRLSVELGCTLSELRNKVRGQLRSGLPPEFRGVATLGIAQTLKPVIDAVRQTGFSVLAVAVGRVPLVLTPAPGVHVEDLEGEIPVRIYWDEAGWYLRRAEGRREEELFSFDVPEVVLGAYLNQDRLSPIRALDLKGRELAVIKAIIERHGAVRTLTFRLDQEWLEQVRMRLKE
ncbi:MAG: hypothetical protein KIT19_10790 [Phycisphaeraceae bacterium]|nr:hypothetical protein [Phycisphaeraceae bacterium]